MMFTFDLQLFGATGGKGNMDGTTQTTNQPVQPDYQYVPYQSYRNTAEQPSTFSDYLGQQTNNNTYNPNNTYNYNTYTPLNYNTPTQQPTTSSGKCGKGNIRFGTNDSQHINRQSES